MLSLMFWRDWSLSYRNAKIWAHCRWGFCLSSPNFPLSSGTWINQETESTLSSVSLPGPLLASSVATVVALLWHWISSIAKENPGPRSWPTSCLWHERATNENSEFPRGFQPESLGLCGQSILFSLSIYSSIQDTINIFQLATCFSHVQWSGICPNSYISL